MYNPIRRNRNIGTAKQGHGQNNKLCIPCPLVVSKMFYEQIENYHKEIRIIHGREFVFVVEATLHDFEHACSVDEVAKMLHLLPAEDLGKLGRIVFRQPKRKEAILSPVWGRLVLHYEFENHFEPTIILEAFNINVKLKWPKSLSVESQKELEWLRQDGHKFVTDRRSHIASFEKSACRNTQLYRTLLHEVGHYVHYLQEVIWPLGDHAPPEKYQIFLDRYFDGIPERERETFAHSYAERQYAALVAKKVVPFEQK